MSVFSENRPEVVIIEIACLSQSITISPIPTRAAEYASVSRILDLTEARTLCVSKLTLPLILDMHRDNYIDHLRAIICFDSDLDQETMDAIHSMKYISFFTYEEVLNRGKAIMDEIPDFKVCRSEPLNDSVYLLASTSGTTGEPTVSMITHSNIASAIFSNAGLGFVFGPEDRYLSYVTLSHIFEQIMIHICIRHRIPLSFARTGSDVWEGPDPQLLIEDLQASKPTIFGSFPTFFNKIYRSVQSKLPA